MTDEETEDKELSSSEFRQRNLASDKSSYDEKEVISNDESEESINEEIEEIRPEQVRVYRRVVASQSNSPSYLSRQCLNIKSFILELFDFILLFLTTLFNPMADVNNQVQEHNQRKMAREGRFFASCKPKTSSFPGCGPSS